MPAPVFTVLVLLTIEFRDVFICAKIDFSKNFDESINESIDLRLLAV